MFVDLFVYFANGAMLVLPGKCAALFVMDRVIFPYLAEYNNST